MVLRKKKVKGNEYYYLELSYFVIDGSKKFTKYLGSKKPAGKELGQITEKFRGEILEKLSGKKYSAESISKDDAIKTLLFRDAFMKKFESMSPAGKKRFEVDRTILFTLTTLTTEDVDVSLKDVEEAYRKGLNLTLREQISKNMLNAVDSIKQKKELSKSYLLGLHKTIMSSFETKSPGKLRQKQVYLHKRDEENPLSIEIAYRPPEASRIPKLLQEFIKWHNKSKLNPIEKAALTHYKLYAIHPFLDGNKRICRLLFNKTLLDEGFPLVNISEKREKYFKALIDSVENKKPGLLVKFSLKEYLKQVKEFTRNSDRKKRKT